jgi:glycine cleavage system aminomethyltransferase T
MRAIIEDETMDGQSSTSANRLLADYQLATTGTDFDFRPPGRISPFFDCANAAGAHAYQRHLNSYMPWKYGDREDEQYHALVTAATLVDVHSLHVIQIKGPEAIAFVDRLVTRDVTKMQEGRSSYVFVCDPEGLILADPVMLMLDRETIWMTVGTVDLLLWVKGAAVFAGMDVTVSEVPAPSVQVAGPKAREVLQHLVSVDLGAIKPFRCLRATFAGLDVVVSTTGYSDQQSYELFLIGAEPYPHGRDLGNRMWRAIVAAGAPLGLRESPVEYDRSIEAGFVTIGHTEGEKVCALEHWLPGIVDLAKGDFIGKAALRAIRDAGGPKRRMVGLVASDPEARFTLAQWDMDVWQGTKVVGTSRRLAWSRALERAIAIAFIDVHAAAPGTKLVLPHGTAVDDVTVVELPFVARRV